MKLLNYVWATVAVALITLLSVVLVGASLAEPATVTVTAPSGPVTFGELNEYASRVWNDPWDMSQPLDVRQLDSAQCSGVPNHFVEVTPCPGGIWCGRATTNNPDLFLLFPGHDAIHTGRDGNVKPIDAAVYRQLTFRMYVESVNQTDPGLQVYWTNGTMGDLGGTPAKFGASHFYKVYPGWHIYTIDLGMETDPILGNLPWTGSITGLRLDPAFQGMTNRQVQLDWVRLTPRETRRVSWATGDTGALSIRLQKSGDAAIDPLHFYTIDQDDRANEVSLDAQDGDYDVPASLPPGDWFVHLATTDGSNSGPAGPWQVQAAPALDFVAPSYTTGEDYAWTQLGEVWDMNEPSDIDSTGNLAAAPSFIGGELVATTADTNPDNDCTPYWEDPFIYVLDETASSQAPVETDRYRYFSFRIRVEGTPDVSFGWVSRLVWTNQSFFNCGLSEDIPLHAGWNEVYLDLWDPNILEIGSGCEDPWLASAQRRQLRLDPLEIPVATTFHLDWVKLAAMDSAPANGTFAVKYLRNAVNASVAFYYDTDKNPTNHRVRMNEFVPPGGPAWGPWSIFLPGVFRLSQPITDPAGTQVFWWDLDGVAPGAYYVSAVLTGAHHTTTWYSDTPVNVTN